MASNAPMATCASNLGTEAIGGYGWSTQITDFLVLGVGETEATFKAQALLAQMSDWELDKSPFVESI